MTRTFKAFKSIATRSGPFSSFSNTALIPSNGPAFDDDLAPG